jgi:hypothetical protein
VLKNKKTKETTASRKRLFHPNPPINKKIIKENQNPKICARHKKPGVFYALPS